MKQIRYTLIGFFLSLQLSIFAQTSSDSSFHTKIIGHKCGYHGISIPNTLSSIQQNCSFFDGLEMDVFLSKDRTLWLSHNQWIVNSDSTKHYNILTLRDSEIEAINNNSKGKLEYTKLENIFLYLSQIDPKIIISLDIKPWIPTGFSSLNIPNIRKNIAKIICVLQLKYGLKNILVESESIALMHQIKRQNSEIQCYLLALKNPSKMIQKAIRGNIDGISFKYFSRSKISTEDIKLLHKNKLKIQAWTINTIEDFNHCEKLSIDFIQTDEILRNHQ